jgi:FMN reductase
MFSYLHAVVSPTAVYAATDDFGQAGSSGLGQRIERAAADFTRLMRSCGSRARRDVFDEEVGEMTRLLVGSQSGESIGNVED